MVKVAMNKFLYALRGWGLPMTAGFLLADVLILGKPLEWPWPAAFKYPFMLVFCTVWMTLLRWKHLGSKPSPQRSDAL